MQDGASTDDSLEYLQKLSLHASCVQSMPDGGIYDAMNRLTDRAKGRYILFLNAGDALAAPGTLKTLHTALATINPAFAYGDSLEDLNGSQKPKAAKPHTQIAKGMFTHHQAMLYSLNHIENLRYNTTYKIAADYDFTARFLKQNTYNAQYIPEALCVFESGGVSQQNATLGRREQFQIRKDLQLCCPAQNHAIKALQALNWQLRRFAPALYWLLKR